MTLSESDLDHVLKLAHLEIPQSERSNYLSQLQKVLSHMEGINQLNLNEVSESEWNKDQSTPERDDKIEDRHVHTMEDIAPKWEDGAFVVPQIIGDT